MTQILSEFFNSTHIRYKKPQRNIFMVLNQKNIEPRLLYLAKLSFTYKRVLKI